MFTLPLQNSYKELPEIFYQKIRPQETMNPQLLQWNKGLAQELQIKSDDLSSVATYFSGKTLPVDVDSLAQAYSGHQFGHFSPLLGDGRAVLLGEIRDRSGHLLDIHLKGSGPTRFSRRGDGRSALGPALREYLVSEAMFGLGVPTTRSLAVIGTGEGVYRQEGVLPGGLLVRVAKSHIRVGTFEFAAQQNDVSMLKALADYTINRHYPKSISSYKDFYFSVIESQSRLVANWMAVGFIHGVMNTDNMTISGETIDYGPCAFMNYYNPRTVYSFIDSQGRYAYGHQPGIAQWNLQVLGYALRPLLRSENSDDTMILNEAMKFYVESFQRYWQELVSKKMGMNAEQRVDVRLLKSFFEILEQENLDFTLSFRYLMNTLGDLSLDTRDFFKAPSRLKDWVEEWKKDLRDKGVSEALSVDQMSQVNPIYIPRNHKVEHTLHQAVHQNDFTEFEKLLERVSQPFQYRGGEAERKWILPPQEGEDIENTFCGT